MLRKKGKLYCMQECTVSKSGKKKKKYIILFSPWQYDHILLILIFLIVATYCFSWELLLMWKDLVFFNLYCVSGKDVCGFEK